jgi:hypothetical protein
MKAVHGFRHYEVRLRQSRRAPYVAARWLLAASAAVVLVAAVLYVSERL